MAATRSRVGYAEKDERIRVYRNQALVSAAENHNIAITKMSPQSKYCKFLHADDWLFPGCLAEMVGLAEGASVRRNRRAPTGSTTLAWISMGFPIRVPASLAATSAARPCSVRSTSSALRHRSSSVPT